MVEWMDYLMVAWMAVYLVEWMVGLLAVLMARKKAEVTAAWMDELKVD